MKARIALVAVTMLLSTAALAEVELSILGGQTTFNNSSFHAEADNGDGRLDDLNSEIQDVLNTDFDASDVSSDFAPGLRLGVRLGDSPVLATIGARHSDHLDTSYDAGLRLNSKGSDLGLELRAVRFDDSSVRSAFGSREVEGEAAVTYDLGVLRLGAGVTTATLDDQRVNGLLTADLVFTFGGKSAAPAMVLVPKAPVVVPAPEAPIVEKTGERG